MENRNGLLVDFRVGPATGTAERDIAQNTSRRRSALDARTTRHPGYAVSLKVRKRVEEIFGFGWMKTIGGFRKTRFRGVERIQLAAYFVGAAYNLLRMAKLLSA